MLLLISIFFMLQSIDFLSQLLSFFQFDYVLCLIIARSSYYVLFFILFLFIYSFIFTCYISFIYIALYMLVELLLLFPFVCDLIFYVCCPYCDLILYFIGIVLLSSVVDFLFILQDFSYPFWWLLILAILSVAFIYCLQFLVCLSFQIDCLGSYTLCQCLCRFR